MHSQGKRFKTAVRQNAPLSVLGAINAYTAMLAERAGAKALYLSGAGVANASFGLPDLGMTGLNEVLEDARRITQATEIPLLVDIDTGFGHELCVARAIKSMERAGVAAVHIEDQRAMKRCGHRPHKQLVSLQVMGDKIKAAVDARVDPNFVIMARTDAYAVEGLQAALERIEYYIELGADMIFPEALTTLEEYQWFTQASHVPVLANITEFGRTPLFTRKELQAVGISLILYPLSAFRAMSMAALEVYSTILEEGTQSSLLDAMQTREALYDVLNYHHYEEILDREKEQQDDE